MSLNDFDLDDNNTIQWLCLLGHKGLICNDTADEPPTKEEQIRAVYLLTLGNFAFLPALVLAVYRRYFTLAAIFFFNFFFSGFYHACDASYVYQLCYTHYDALQFCDFFGSELSFWGVLLIMARIPEGARTFLLVSGVMVIALLEANARRHNGLTFVAPILVGGIIVVASWGWEMRRRRQLFPTRRRYLLCLLPGALLALSGILVKYFVKPLASYQYGHSYWHLAVRVASCFLMPPRRREAVTAPTGLSVSSGDVRPCDAHAGELGQENEDAMFDANMNSLGINTDRQNLI